MSPALMLFIAMVLLLIGINFAANNTFHSYIIAYIFYDDQMSNKVLRLIGFAILSSVLLLIFELYVYAALVNMISVLFFIFLSIRGRAKADQQKRRKKAEAQQAYLNEIEKKQKEISTIKERNKSDYEKSKTKPQSVKEIKEKLWDDGTMTKKEIIDNLKK